MTTAAVAVEETAPKKSLLEQILEWSETLPVWQRDALRRLFVRSSPELTEADYEELFTLLKKGKGILGVTAVAAIAWSKEHLPNTAANTQHAKLKSMRDLKYVNKIALGQVLQFAPQGMTIVYGGNGSGKSGYSRVLKRACRARDQSEPIHPDATDAGQVGKVPEASFEIELDGKAKTVGWSLKDPPPDDLATIAVFDGMCARAYLTTEGNVAYMPYGLDVVANLADKVIPRLDGMLTKELASIDVDSSILATLKGDTKIGKLVEKFGPKTDEDALKQLATVSSTDVARLDEIEKTLAQDDPVAAAKKVRLERQRIIELIKRIDAACAIVSDKAVEKLKGLDANDVAAAKAVEIAAKALRSGEQLLPGTGDTVWRRMFDAARKFSTEVAYPGHAFPHTGADAVCPLCQQGVTNAADRLKRFAEFLRHDTATAAAHARRAAGDATMRLGASNVGFGIDEALASELVAVGTVVEAVTEFEKSVGERRGSMLKCVAEHEWSGVSAIGDDPRPILEQRAARLADTAAELDNAGDAEKRKLLIAERNELKTRVDLKRELKR
jgi:hypothetical protein